MIKKVSEFKQSANFYGIGGFAVIAGAAILLLTIYRDLLLAMPCPFRAITGIPCPSCGSTRFAFAMLDFQFLQAFKFNPLLFVFSVILVIQFLISLYFTLKKQYYQIRFSPKMIKINKVLFFIFLLGIWLYQWLIFPNW